jgi:hypothetical protein
MRLGSPNAASYEQETREGTLDVHAREEPSAKLADARLAIRLEGEALPHSRLATSLRGESLLNSPLRNCSPRV